MFPLHASNVRSPKIQCKDCGTDFLDTTFQMTNAARLILLNSLHDLDPPPYDDHSLKCQVGYMHTLLGDRLSRGLVDAHKNVIPRQALDPSTPKANRTTPAKSMPRNSLVYLIGGSKRTPGRITSTPRRYATKAAGGSSAKSRSSGTSKVGRPPNATRDVSVYFFTKVCLWVVVHEQYLNSHCRTTMHRSN